MKLSEFKEIIITQFGEKGWKQLKNTYGYEVYIATNNQQNLLVQNNGTDIRYINNPSEELQLIAIENNLKNFQYIDKPSEKIKIEAVNRNPSYIQYIKNPSDEILLKFLEGIEYVGEMVNFLKYIENDLRGEKKDEI